MRYFRRLVFLATGAGFIVAGSLVAQSPASLASAPLHRHDPNQIILAKIHAADLAEMHAGALAASKGRRPEVRAYGRRLYDDDQFAECRVTAVAREKGLSLDPPAPAPAPDEAAMQQSRRRAAERLRNLSGSAFDRAFLDATLHGHDETIATLQQEEPLLTDLQTRSLVDQLIPILRQHEALAYDLRLYEGPAVRH
ncbi:MAG TPA: DUF4142 domain-containing protein [Opitutus sp.]|nr:DUF4142 domain-containing protein [Opitutus sp.]